MLFSSCATIPKEAVAVTPFNKTKYLGKWYEIARLDFKFERDMNNTTAEYDLNDDGTIRVNNQGYNYVRKEWKPSFIQFSCGDIFGNKDDSAHFLFGIEPGSHFPFKE